MATQRTIPRLISFLLRRRANAADTAAGAGRKGGNAKNRSSRFSATRVELRGVSKSYVNPGTESHLVMHRLSATFEPGSLTCILGPSGVGKSTLLRIIAGLEAPDEGGVLFRGIRLSLDRESLRVHRRDRVAVVMQGDTTAPTLSVETNAALPLLLQGVHARRALKTARGLLGILGLRRHARKRPAQLSGGQLLRLSLARALVGTAPVLLADEPDANLDAANAARAMTLLRVAAEGGRTVIVITHDELLAHNYADRVLRMTQDGLSEDYREVEPVPEAGEILPLRAPSDPPPDPAVPTWAARVEAIRTRIQSRRCRPSTWPSHAERAERRVQVVHHRRTPPRRRR